MKRSFTLLCAVLAVCSCNLRPEDQTTIQNSEVKENIDPVALAIAGDNFVARGEIYKGIAKYTEAIELKPDYFQAYHNRGIAKEILKDYTGAILDFNIVIKLCPQCSDAYFSRGIMKFNLMDCRGAILDFNLAIRHDPRYGKAYSQRGLCKLNLGLTNEACYDFSKAGELGELEAYDFIEEFCK